MIKSGNQNQNLIVTLQNKSKLLIQQRNGYMYQNVKDIIFCKADLAYTEIYIRNRKRPVVVKQSLKYFSTILPDSFFRIHKSYLINIKYVSEINNSNDVTLEDGTNLEVARRRKKEFIKALIVNKEF